jgi:hypothetical protein
MRVGVREVLISSRTTRSSRFFHAHGLGGSTWWTGGAQHLLPALPKLMHLDHPRLGDEAAQIARWPALVTEAAEHWTAIANEWALIMIPEFMDPTSAEYLEWLRFASAQETLRERAEYERLKIKFER